MLVEILAGTLLGLTVLAAVLHLARRRPRRAAPHGRTTAGLVTTAPGPAGTRPTPGRGRPGSDAATVGDDDLPAGTRMLPLDLWDAAVLVLIAGMILAVPVVGGLVAALVLPLVVVAPLLAFRLLSEELVARTHREE